MEKSPNKIEDTSATEEFSPNIPYSMPTAKFVTILSILYGKFWIFFCMGGCILFLILGIALDIRWIIVMLMWIFILIPLTLAFLYIFYGLQPLNATNVALHTIDHDDEQFLVDIYSKNIPPEQDDDKPEKHNQQPSISRTITLQYSSAKKYMFRPDGLVIEFEAPNKGFLWIPIKDMPSRNICERLKSQCNIK